MTRAASNKYVAPTKSSYLDSLLANQVVKQDSADWLTGALDPFHDFNYIPAGLPDQYSGSSVVQFIKKKKVISKPAGITGDWDLHIFTLPVMSTGAARPYSYVNPAQATQAQTTTNLGQLGTLCFYAVPAGTSPFPTGNGSTYAVPTGASLIAASPTDDGNAYSMMRLIGGGFEVHNDTAELYKRGSVTVYSQPTQLQSRQVAIGVSNPSVQSGYPSTALVQVQACRLPPRDISEATSNITARTWTAAEGVYAPFQLDVAHSDFELATASPIVAFDVDSSFDYPSGASANSGWGSELDLKTTYNYTDAIGPVAAGYYAEQYHRADTPLRLARQQTVGAYFTGLGSETVLTVDYRFIVEVAPTPINTSLISLATPSSEYDPMALAIYSRAIRELPPAVKVNMNAAGDWWKIVSVALKNVAPILTKLGPYGMAAGVAAGGLSHVGDMVYNHATGKKEKAREGTASPSKDRSPNDQPPKQKQGKPRAKAKPSARKAK